MQALADILTASGRALRSLLQPGVVWHLVWPVLLAALVWIIAGSFCIGPLADWSLSALHGLPRIGAWFGEAGQWSHLAASGLLEVLLWLALLPLIVATALVFIATFGLPLMLDRVAARDYADLQRRCGGSQWGSLRTALGAFAIFLILFILSLPLWLIPGVGGVISALLSAWMNKRCLCYDALMNHADALELVQLPCQHAWRLRLLALIGGVLTLVPLLNLIIPAWISLCFVHYLLNALREQRSAIALAA